MAQLHRRRQKRATPRVVLVGCGRLGGALALGLRSAGWDIATLPHSENSARRATALGIPLTSHDELKGVQLCILAVHEAAMHDALQFVGKGVKGGTAFVHTSGSTQLRSFKNVKPVGSFHPLVAVSDPRDELTGHAVALAATDSALKATLLEMATALQLTPIEIPEERRVLYHAGAVLAAGLLVALTDAALEALTEAKLRRQVALQALLPLMRSALRGIEARGLEGGLTGPLARGELGVVQTHLEALPKELKVLYKVLSRRALQLKPTLPKETHTALERLLL